MADANAVLNHRKPPLTRGLSFRVKNALHAEIRANYCNHEKIWGNFFAFVSIPTTERNYLEPSRQQPVNSRLLVLMMLTGQMAHSSKDTYDALLKTLDGRRKVEVDKIDLRILNALQVNNRLTNLELAQLVGLSPPTCLRRVRRLREERVIVGDVCLVDLSKLGDFLTFLVSVVLREEVRSSMAQMERQFRALPEVTQCYLVTGDSDYLLVVVVPTMRDYEQFTQDVLYANSAIQRFTTLTVMKNVKFSNGISLEDVGI